MKYFICSSLRQMICFKRGCLSLLVNAKWSQVSQMPEQDCQWGKKVGLFNAGSKRMNSILPEEQGKKQMACYIEVKGKTQKWVCVIYCEWREMKFWDQPLWMREANISATVTMINKGLCLQCKGNLRAAVKVRVNQWACQKTKQNIGNDNTMTKYQGQASMEILIF